MNLMHYNANIHQITTFFREINLSSFPKNEVNFFP